MNSNKRHRRTTETARSFLDGVFFASDENLLAGFEDNGGDGERFLPMGNVYEVIRNVEKFHQVGAVAKDIFRLATVGTCQGMKYLGTGHEHGDTICDHVSARVLENRKALLPHIEHGS